MAHKAAVRITSGLVSVTLVLAGVLAATSANAAVAPHSAVTVDGFLTTPSSADPDQLLVNYTITVQGDPLSNTVLQSRLFPGQPIDPATVTVDGAPVPADTVSATAHRLTVRLGTGADSLNGGSVDVGSFLLSYVQQRPTGTGPNASTHATLRFNRNGTPGEVTSNEIQLLHPDLTLQIPRGSGEDQIGYLGDHTFIDYGAVMRNRGGDASGATLTITLAPGLAVATKHGVFQEILSLSDDGGFDFGRRLHCTSPANDTVTCAVGAVAHGTQSIFDIPFTAKPSAHPGEIAKFGVSVSPKGEPDQDTTNDKLTGRIKFTGTAKLTTTLTAAKTKVPLGDTTTVHIQVHNAGPQPAAHAFALAVVINGHFKLVKFTTNRHPQHGRAFTRVPIPPSQGAYIEWNIGTLGAGHSARAQMLLKSRKLGKSQVQVLALSAAGNPSCRRPSNCPALARLKMQSVKAAKPGHKSAPKSATLASDHGQPRERARLVA